MTSPSRTQPLPTRRSILLAGGCAAALTALAAPTRVRAADPGIDTLRLLVGFAPGGTTDVTARRLGDQLRGHYAKVVVVENKAGAAGRIGCELLKAAPPDGATMLLTPASVTMIYPHIYKALSYDAFTDVLPVADACDFDFGLGVGPAVPASVKTVPDFIAWCKANPGSANYGSPAAGSVPHFVGALLAREAGIEMRHVPFRGSQPAIQDMLGGQISSVSAPLGEFLPHLKGGRVRILGTSGEKRSQFMPEVATYAEQGFKSLTHSEYFFIAMPPKTPLELQARASEAINRVTATREYAEGIAQMGLLPGKGTPREMVGRLKADYDAWGPIVKEIGFTAES